MHVFYEKRIKVFDKYNEIWEKVSNIIKRKFNSELVYKKKYIKTESKTRTKECFQCFYTPVIVIDSVYRKVENYYLKVFLEKYNFNESIEIYSNYYYYVDSDDEKHIDLFLETMR